MITSTHRWISDPALAFLPTQATTGGIDFTRYFANRSWVLEASGVLSHVTGDREAIGALQTNAGALLSAPRREPPRRGPRTPRPSPATAAPCASARSDKGRLRLTDHFHWYSPGLDLNDLGYLRQADVLANQVFLGWSEPSPKGIFRELLVPALARGPVGLRRARRRRATTAVEASAPVREQVEGLGPLRLRPGGRHAGVARRPRPALARLLHRAPGARAAIPPGAPRSRSRPSTRGPSTTTRDRRASWATLNLRPSNRLSLSGEVSYERSARQPAVRRDGGDRRGAALGARTDRPGHLELHFPRQPVDHARADGPVLREPVHRHRPVHGLQEGNGHPGDDLRGPLPPVRARRDRLRPGGQLVPGLGGRRTGRRVRLRQPRLQLPPVPLEPRRALGVQARARRSTSSGRRAAPTPSQPGSRRSPRTGTRCGSLRPDNVFLVKLSYWFSP